MGLKNRVRLQTLVSLTLDIAFEWVLIIEAKDSVEVKSRHLNLLLTHVQDEVWHHATIESMEVFIVIRPPIVKELVYFVDNL